MDFPYVLMAVWRYTPIFRKYPNILMVVNVAYNYVTPQFDRVYVSLLGYPS